MPTAYPRACIFPAKAGEQMSLSHVMRGDFPAGMPRPDNFDSLRERIRQIERPACHDFLPFGVAAIDHALPGGGLARGAVHEILGAGGDEEDGAAASGFAAAILARLSPHPPAANSAGPPPPAVPGRGRMTSA